MFTIKKRDWLLFDFRYAIAFLFVPMIAWSVYIGGWWSFHVPVIVFGLIPLLELFFPGITTNLSEQEEQQALANPIFDLLVYAAVPLQYGLVLYFLYRISSTTLGWFELLGMTISVGIACGAYGINIGHELGHRKKPFEKFLAKALLLTSMYMHFFIEHNRGHHKQVATEEDPATARHGEVLYSFWFRSIISGYISAWKIENERLQKKRAAWYSLQNEMLWFQLIQLAVLGIIYAIFGFTALCAFLVAALVGILELETINYIEHYGLLRKKKTKR